MEIRAAVQGGRVEDAIDKVNDLGGCRVHVGGAARSRWRWLGRAAVAGGGMVGGGWRVEDAVDKVNDLDPDMGGMGGSAEGRVQGASGGMWWVAQ